MAPASAAANTDLQLLITESVRGAHMPVNKWSQQCSSPDDCGCDGGAHRRRAYLGDGTATDDANVVALDMGGYATGSGTFYAVFGGNASAEFFASSQYEAFGLTFHDFLYGPEALAAYLETARGFWPSLPPATVTNYNLTGDAVLAGHIVPYTLVSLSGGKALAVLSLTASQHIAHEASKDRLVEPFRHALLRTLATLRRLTSPPEVVVCLVTRIPLDSVAATGEALARARSEAVRELAQEAIGVDVMVLGSVTTEFTTPYTVRNFAGDDVLIVPTGGSSDEEATLEYGRQIVNVSMALTEEGYLLRETVRHHRIQLGCTAAVHNATRTRLLERYEEMEKRLGEPVGTLATALDAPRKSEPRGTCGRSNVTIQGVSTCGCRVASCAQGAFIADALANAFPAADFAILNAGGIQSSVAAGPVSRADLVALYPYTNEAILLRISGATLKAALVNSLSQLGAPDAATDPGDGRFLQVSSQLRVSWRYSRGVPILRSVEVRPRARSGAHGEGRGDHGSDATLPPFAPLNETAIYSVVLPDFIANGNDEYTMFAPVAQTQTGTSLVDAAIAYLSTHSPVALPGVHERITQQPGLAVVQLGLLCPTRPTGGAGAPLVLEAERREECDHVHHVVELLNNKADGFLDELLPNVLVQVAEAHAGCNDLLATSALASLRTTLPEMRAVIGPWCSSDVIAVASAAYRTGANFSLPLISPSSTAMLLANETSYPNVARLTTSESHVAEANAVLAKRFGWSRVAVLADDTTWGADASEQFVRHHRRLSEDAVILNEDDPSTRSFSVADFAQAVSSDERLRRATALLRRLDDLGTRVVYLACEPSLQERFFAASAASGLLNGVGFAWLSGWMSFDALSQEGKLSALAVEGAVGLLGMRDQIDASSSLYVDYHARWRAASNRAGCTAPGRAYCEDDDEDLTASIAGYSMNAVESAVLLAKALDALRDVNERSPFSQPDALYAKIRQLGQAGYDGPSGRVVLDDSADRLGTFSVLNIQVSKDPSPTPSSRLLRRLEESPQTPPARGGVRAVTAAGSEGMRRLALSYQEVVSAAAVTVGQYVPTEDTSNRLSGLMPGQVMFSGRATEVPADQLLWEDTTVVTMAILGSLGGLLAVVMLCLFYRYIRKLYNTYEARKAAEAEFLRQSIQRLHDCCEKMVTLQFCLCFIKLSDFRSHGRLLPHEEVRQRGQLTILDTFEEVRQFDEDHFVVFVSHQWLGWKVPDPANVHYQAVCQALKQLCEANDLDESTVWLWIDYSSIPQRNKTLQQLSIRSLALYASMPDYFIIIAPQTTHLDAKKICNAETYQRRGWCRLEQWARLAVGGIDGMYLYDGRKLEPLTSKDRWLKDSIRVFDGDFTVDADKPKLVDTAIGLWATTYHHHKLVEATQSAEATASESMYALVQETKDAVFPEALFGRLILQLEDLIDAGELTPVLHYQAAGTKAMSTRDSVSKRRAGSGSDLVDAISAVSTAAQTISDRVRTHASGLSNVVLDFANVGSPQGSGEPGAGDWNELVDPARRSAKRRLRAVAQSVMMAGAQASSHVPPAEAAAPLAAISSEAATPPPPSPLPPSRVGAPITLTTSPKPMAVRATASVARTIAAKWVHVAEVEVEEEDRGLQI